MVCPGGFEGVGRVQAVRPVARFKQRGQERVVRRFGRARGRCAEADALKRLAEQPGFLTDFFQRDLSALALEHLEQQFGARPPGGFHEAARRTGREALRLLAVQSEPVHQLPFERGADGVGNCLSEDDRVLHFTSPLNGVDCRNRGVVT